MVDAKKKQPTDPKASPPAPTPPKASDKYQKDIENLGDDLKRVKEQVGQVNAFLFVGALALFVALVGVLTQVFWAHMSTVAEQEANNVEFQKEVRSLNEKLSAFTPSPTPTTKKR